MAWKRVPRSSWPRSRLSAPWTHAELLWPVAPGGRSRLDLIAGMGCHGRHDKRSGFGRRACGGTVIGWSGLGAVGEKSPIRLRMQPLCRRELIGSASVRGEAASDTIDVPDYGVEEAGFEGESVWACLMTCAML